MFNILSKPIKFSKVNSDIDIVARKLDDSIKIIINDYEIKIYIKK